jgi:Zn-dependent membrane protease YugP
MEDRIYDFGSYGLYLLISLPALLLGLWAQSKVRSSSINIHKYYSNGMNGSDVARVSWIVMSFGDVIKETSGTLSDNYDPRNKTLNLSAGCL